MKCLSVRQPFTWAILKGRKRVENRARFPNFYGAILLHAGKTVENIGPKFPDKSKVPPLESLPTGSIVGAVVIRDCVPSWVVLKYLENDLGFTREGTFIVGKGRKATEHDCGDDLEDSVISIIKDEFAMGGPAFVLLESPIEFQKPIPFSGQVGLFNVDETKLPLLPTDRKKLEQLFKKNPNFKAPTSR